MFGNKMKKRGDIKTLVAGVTFMLAVIGLVISLGSLPMILLYRPHITPTRNIYGILVSVTVLGIAAFGVLRTPSSQIADILLKTAVYVSFIVIVGVGNHVIGHGLTFPYAEIPLLLGALSIILGAFIAYRSRMGLKFRKYLKT